MVAISDSTMKAPRTCGRCGATVPPFAPDQLCPRCLFDTAWDLDDDLPTDLPLANRKTDEERPANPPRIFGDYDLLGELGQGGQGTVYRARHRSMGRIVALKTIPASGASALCAPHPHISRTARTE